MMTNTDKLAEDYYQDYDITLMNDEEWDEAETLQHISVALQRVFEDLTEDQKQIAMDNADEIIGYVEELIG